MHGYNEQGLNDKMRAEDLKTSELITQDDLTSFPVMSTYRIMMIGMAGLSRLFKDLVRGIGWDKMQILLFRFGYDGGMSHAEVISKLYNFENHEELLKAGSMLRKLAGLAEEELNQIELHLDSKKLIFTGRWHDSFETLIWKNNFGRSDTPVCSILTGLLSGYASTVLGAEVFVKETTCQAQGHAFCSFEGRSVQEWGMSPDAIRHKFDIKSFDENIADLRHELQRAKKFIARQDAEIMALKRESEETKESRIIFRSDAMAKTLRLAAKVAPTDTNVLIYGKSGTGKELLAKYMHDKSGRKVCPFLDINCAALPENLLESELFGYEKGAFTGADKRKKGLFIEAGQGTLFLDEISELPFDLQAKLLRVLQQKVIRPIGSATNIPLKARIICATNQDLKILATQGRFREDLYYRIAVFPISIPSLKERPQDILILARHFLKQLNPNHPGFSPEAVRKLEFYNWPGNVRELQNWIEYAAVLASDHRIRPEHLPLFTQTSHPQNSSDIISDLPTFKELESRYIQQVLAHTQGNKSKASEILGISLSTLWRRSKTPVTCQDVA